VTSRKTAGFALAALVVLAGCGELDRASEDAYDVGKSVDTPVNQAEDVVEQSESSVEQLQGEVQDVSP
jgi:hypothetical protein